MKYSLRIAVALGALTLSTAQVFSAEEDDTAYRVGYGLVLEQKWAEAQSYFERFQQDFSSSAWADDAAFWRCYAIEQANTQDADHFNCYRAFVDSWPQSSWVSDARSKLLVLGTRLASRGNPEYIEQLRSLRRGVGDFDFDFDFDGDAIADSVAEAMDRAQQELARVRLSRNTIVLPELPDLPDLADLPDRDQLNELREVMRNAQRQMERGQREIQIRKRNSADDELLSVLAALRDNERASDILIERFDSSDDPELRARIVLLLENFRGDSISTKLVDIIHNEDDENVRNNAIVVLLDRNDETHRDLLIDLVVDPVTPLRIREEILGDLDRWDEARVLPVLANIVRTEPNARLVSTAADTLADIGSTAALDELINAYGAITVVENKLMVLAEIADVDSPRVVNFLSEVALSDVDDETASVAIEGIADTEDNIAVAALEHIYLNTTNTQRRLAVIHGVGEAETARAVEVLQLILQDTSDVQVTAAVVRALGDTRQASAVSAVVAAYRDNSDEAVQREAIRALRQLDEYPDATDALLEILEDRLDAQGAQ